MKTTTVLFIIFLGLTYSGYAQVCGTPEPKIKGSLIINSPSFLNRTEPICVNVFYHIIRDDNGNGGINQSQLELITEDLNLQFSDHDIIFNTNGFDYIDDTDFQTINNSTEAASLAQVNNFSHSINYYIVNSLWNVGAGFVTGTAISIPSNNLVIRSDRVLTSTSPHEMGHCLNLWHTFQGTAPNTTGCAEAINGSNCATCGDRVCDTPADANSGNSGGFSPSLINYMSYYTNRNEFTLGQADRIRQAFASSILLQQVVAPACNAGIDGLDALCSGDTAVYTFNNLPSGATITWSSSYVLSGQGTPQVTIGAFTGNPSISISATVVYNGNSTVYNKTVTVIPNEYPSTPTIILSPNNPNSLVCCGQTYTFEHTKCYTNCNNIEWEYEVYSSNPQDYYALNTSGNTAYVTMQKNTYSPFILNAKARNVPENCGNPSSLSNGITRYYGVIASRFSGTDTDKNNLNKRLPLLERFYTSTNTLEVEKVDLYEWFDALYSNKNLNDDEVKHIVDLIAKEKEFFNVKIELFNITGFHILTKDMETSKASYDLSHLTSGIYFIKYSYAGESVTNKFIVN